VSSTISSPGESESSSSGSSASSSVSIGAAVGGGVGAGLGLFFILFAVVFLVRRRRMAGKEAEKGSVYPVQEEDGRHRYQARSIHELGRTDSRIQAGELEGDYSRQF
jgi:hypothetical protein